MYRKEPAVRVGVRNTQQRLNRRVGLQFELQIALPVYKHNACTAAVAGVWAG